MVAVALKLPSAEVALIRTFPTALVVTTPFTTVAIRLFVEDHVTVLFVALVGAITGVKVPVCPRLMVRRVGVTVKPVTRTTTLNVREACFPPSSVVAVMVVVPGVNAVTRPDALTLPTSGEELDHVIFLLEALDGVKEVAI